MSNSTVEILSNGKTVWVNGADGCCLAQFSRFGIDVHKDAVGQQSGSQCLDCKHGVPAESDWQRFRSAVLFHYGITVKEKHKPKFIEDDSHGN